MTTEGGGLIETAAGIRELSERLEDCKRVGLDTEFVGERTYVPQLELLQVSFDDDTAVVDCRAVASLEPLLRVLLERRIEKVVHAGYQDLELLFGLTGEVPSPVFDTQVAAAMLGYGAQPGYAALVERVLRTTLAKSETLTDWSRRPLSASQIAYAHDDVLHLLPLREQLGERLEKMGRMEWLREELRRLEDSQTYRRPGPAESYLRVRGRGGLSHRGLAILRELATWREEEAERRNRPRGSILSDDLLVEIARRAPQRVESLRNFRGQFARVVERHASAIVELVEKALALPREAWPHPPSHRPLAQPAPGVVEILQAALRLSAEAAQIAPAMVATNADLQALVDAHETGSEANLPLLSGWRYEIAGANLIALLRGEASLRIDPRNGRLQIERG